MPVHDKLLDDVVVYTTIVRFDAKADAVLLRCTVGLRRDVLLPTTVGVLPYLLANPKGRAKRADTHVVVILYWVIIEARCQVRRVETRTILLLLTWSNPVTDYGGMTGLGVVAADQNLRTRGET